MGWLEGKSAVVTGAGRGIGRSIALALAAEGARVVVNDPGANVDGSGTDNGPADQVVEEIRAGGGIAVSNHDAVGAMEAGESIIRTCLNKFGRIDVLINVAGILRDRMIFNLSEDEWDAVINVHLKGHFSTIKPASILMRQQRFGRIINFSSEAGLIGNAGQANYGAAKSAIAGLTRVAARDLGRYGVTVNCIVPRAFTRMIATIPRQDADPAAARMVIKLGDIDFEMASPDFIAPMACHLASDQAWNINGQIFLVYGGVVAMLAQPAPSRTIFKHGMWTSDELSEMVPIMMEGIPNPAPPPPELNVPGRSTPSL